MKHRKRQRANYPGNWDRKRGVRGRYLVKGYGQRVWDDELPCAKTRQALKHALHNEIKGGEQ